jgi:hypothetical protein
MTMAAPRIPGFFSSARGDVKHRQLREPRYQPPTEERHFRR